MDAKMQSYLAQMLGKTVKAVLVKQCEQGSLREQVFLVFDDDTYFEFYSRDGTIEAAKGLKSGSLDEVREYMGPECPNVIDISREQEMVK